MEKKNIIVKNVTTGKNVVENMDCSISLKTCREKLISLKLMDINDYFLQEISNQVSSNTDEPISRDYVENDTTQEEDVLLSEFINQDNKLFVGRAKNNVSVNDHYDRYYNMNNNEKMNVLKGTQVFRGISYKPGQMSSQSFKDLFSLAKLPESNIPQVVSEISTISTCTEFIHKLQTSGSESASVSLDTPYASGEANFKYENSKTENSREMNLFLTSKFIINKVDLSIQIDDIIINNDFINSIIKATSGYVKGDVSKEKDTLYNVLNVLNEWGYYVLHSFSLGGVLFSTDETKITEYSQIDTEKTEYGGSFKAAFDGIGGGGAYNNSSSSTTTNTTSTKYQNLTITQMGGIPGSNNDYPKWANSLDNCENWVQSTKKSMFPSLYFLNNGDEDSRNALTICLKLMNSYSSIGKESELQPYLNIGKYATSIEKLLLPVFS